MANKIGKSDKTLDDFFRDWEGEAFGFGYGSGEEVILPLLRKFLALCVRNDGGGYRSDEIEKVIGPEATWFLVNVFGKTNIITYGTSPRNGWLTEEGVRMQKFVASKTDQELYDIVMRDQDDDAKPSCSPGACNCGPQGYLKGIDCPNPFWRNCVQ